MAEILLEYEKAFLINASPETNVREIVVHLEKYLKGKGFNRAFALCAQPCDINVNETIHNNGWDDLGQQTPCTPNHAIGMVLLA